MPLICPHPHQTFLPADNHTQQLKYFFFLNLHLSSHLRHYVIRGSFEQGILTTSTVHPLASGSWPQPSSFSVKSRVGTTLQGAILRAASIALIAAVSDCTYLSILLIFAFTSCWVEKASKGEFQTRGGTELTAPTLTCSGRQRAQAESGIKSQTSLTEGRERLTTLPPAHLQIPVLVFLWISGKKVPKTGRRIWKETVKHACARH